MPPKRTEGAKRKKGEENERRNSEARRESLAKTKLGGRPGSAEGRTQWSRHSQAAVKSAILTPRWEHDSRFKPACASIFWQTLMPTQPSGNPVALVSMPPSPFGRLDLSHSALDLFAGFEVFQSNFLLRLRLRLSFLGVLFFHRVCRLTR